MNFLFRWLVTALAVGVAVWIVPGIELIGSEATWVIIALFALILSLIDMGLKPIVQIVSLPLTILTLGIFYLVVNTFLLYLANWLSTGIFGAGLYISGFFSAFLASIIISIVSVLVNGLIGPDRSSYASGRQV